jgi:hypothetical protein
MNLSFIDFLFYFFKRASHFVKIIVGPVPIVCPNCPNQLNVNRQYPINKIFFASNKRCFSKNKSDNLICRGLKKKLNSELFERTLTEPQLAPPSGESCFSVNNYLLIRAHCSIVTVVVSRQQR